MLSSGIEEEHNSGATNNLRIKKKITLSARGGRFQEPLYSLSVCVCVYVHDAIMSKGSRRGRLNPPRLWLLILPHLQSKIQHNLQGVILISRSPIGAADEAQVSPSST